MKKRFSVKITLIAVSMLMCLAMAASASRIAATIPASVIPPAIVTLQVFVTDTGAAHPYGFSNTNAPTLHFGLGQRKTIEKENLRKLDEYNEKIKEGQEKVVELNDRFGDWYYVISNDVYKQIHLSRDDVIQKKGYTDYKWIDPKKIIVVSSAPQIRYPDCYGIDMARIDDFIAFKATLALLKETGQYGIVDEVYKK